MSKMISYVIEGSTGVYSQYVNVKGAFLLMKVYIDSIFAAILKLKIWLPYDYDIVILGVLRNELLVLNYCYFYN